MSFFGLFDDDKPAPAPDPRIGEAAVAQAQLGRDYLDFAKQQFQISSGLQKQLADKANEISDAFLKMGTDDRARWEKVYKPLEDQFITKAANYDSPERQEAAAAQAKADVQSAADTERGSLERRNASLGVNPASGRWAGTERALGLGTALTSVDRQNTARTLVRDKANALQEDAIGIGRNLPGQAGANLQSGVNAAGVPLTSQIATTGVVQPGYSAAIGGAQGEANTFNQLYKTNVDVWDSENKLKAANAAGLGQAIGTGAGLLLAPGIGGPTSLIGKGLKMMKDGGRPETGEPVIVGEEGPEIFVPDRPGTVVPNHAPGIGAILYDKLHAQDQWWRRTDRPRVGPFPTNPKE